MRLVHFIALCLLISTSLVAYSQDINVGYGGYMIDGSAKKDSAILALLSPYKDSINKRMKGVIGFSVNGLFKQQPESKLGNLMAEAVKTIGETVYQQHIDAAFINYGGVRGYIPKGNITIGTVFELMPFDNLLVLQKVRGDSLLSFLNLIANKNGWPVSGIRMVIKDKKAINVFVNGNALNTDSVYTIANSDYIANGGDDAKMLKIFPQINKGYLIRDALITYISKLTDEGKPIDAKTDKRVVYANE